MKLKIIGRVSSQACYANPSKMYFLRVSMREKRKELLSGDRRLFFSRLLKEFEGKRVRLIVEEVR